MSYLDQPTVSIIIVNWNTRDMLRCCLESVYVNIPPLGFEVIVVDNASTDGSADLVVGEFPEVRLLRNSSNVGFAAASNRGLREALGSYVLLLNPDTELLPGAAAAMVEFAEDHQKIGIVGPKLLNSDGSLQKNGRRFPCLARELLHMTKLHRLSSGWFDRRFEWGREDFDTPMPVDEISGACMLVRAEAIKAVGPLDERFFIYYEDVDWCRRMKDAGWGVHYLPDARVIHHGSQGAKQIGLSKMRVAYRSQYLYFRKHHGLVQAAMVRMLSGCILALMGIRERIFGHEARIL